MEFFKNFDWKSITKAQMIGLAVAALVLIYIVLNIAGTMLRGTSFGMPGIPGVATMAVAPGMGYGGGYGGKAEMAYGGDSYSEDSMMPQLSTRNALTASSIYPPQTPSPMGDTAEQFEVTQYSATIETRNLSSTCAKFDDLKKRDDVIFENANASEHSCNYTFKVKRASVDGVLAWLKDLKPRDLSENTYTIKAQVDDYTNEIEILETKRASIDATLKSAISAYDEVTRLATNSQNADALAKIIDSKIQMIERLSQEKINIDQQLDRLSRSKAQQLDNIDYTYFNANVYENKFVDGQSIRDSWKQAVRDFVQQLNTMIQDLTIGLVLFLLFIVQWLIYALIVLVIAKYGWKFVRNFWTK